MRRFTVVACLLMSFFFAGCESHQAKVDALQKEYNRLGDQFVKDCQVEYYKVPPTLSTRCQEEDKQKTEAWNRLQAERARR